VKRSDTQSDWDRFKTQVEAIGIDPRRPYVAEDHPQFDAVSNILAEFGGVPEPPLPMGWEGHRPVDYDGTLIGIAKWLDFELRQVAADRIFCGGEYTGLAHLNEIIANAYRAFAHLGIGDAPKRQARAAEIPLAVQRIEELLAVVTAKVKGGWRSADEDHPVKKGKVEVAKWADLGIGIRITDDWKFYAFSPVPAHGERVKLKDATLLPLAGERWKAVLGCFADSHNGRTAAKKELVQRLGYHKKGDITEAQAAFDEGLVNKAKKARDKLRVTMAELAFDLRKVVTTTSTSKAKVHRSNGNDYVAAYAVRNLINDEDGRITFGQVQ
jgi:hypothetical protein